MQFNRLNAKIVYNGILRNNNCSVFCMKLHTLLLLIVLLPICNVNAQKVEAEIICFCESEAQFPGGRASLHQYINENFKLPKILDCDYTDRTRVYVSFTITAVGHIRDVTIDRGICEDVDQAVVKMIKSMPDWIPYTKGCGDVFATRVRMPIQIDLR